MSTFSSIQDQLAALNAVANVPASPNVALPTFNITDIQPPTNVYVTTDDQLQVSGWNSAPAQQLIVSIRFLLSTGPTVLGQYSFALPSDRSYWSFEIPLTNGYMLSVTCDVMPTGTTTAQRGQCYVQANVLRTGTPTTVANFTLFSDYVSADLSPSWPSYTNLSSVSGIGAIRSIVGTTPGAGNNLSESVPTNARWRWTAINFTLTTSGVAGNRQVLIFFNDAASNTFYVFVVPYVQTATQQVAYLFSALLGSSQTTPAGGALVSALPEVWTDSAWSFHTGILGLQAADTITLPAFAVQEWIDPGT